MPKSGSRPKTGGIQKGYVYPKTLEFKNRLDQNGFYIVEELIKLYQESDPKKPFFKLAILQEMMKYSYAIPKDYEKPKDPSENEEGETETDISINDILTMIDVTPSKDVKD
jgi:hypothetical protein